MTSDEKFDKSHLKGSEGVLDDRKTMIFDGKMMKSLAGEAINSPSYGTVKMEPAWEKLSSMDQVVTASEHSKQNAPDFT